MCGHDGISSNYPLAGVHCNGAIIRFRWKLRFNSLVIEVLRFYGYFSYNYRAGDAFGSVIIHQRPTRKSTLLTQKWEKILEKYIHKVLSCAGIHPQFHHLRGMFTRVRFSPMCVHCEDPEAAAWIPAANLQFKCPAPHDGR